MPNTQPFPTLQASLQALYQAGNYLEALDLVQQAAALHPAQLPLLVYWQIVLTASLGDIGQALETLAAAQEDGIWYAEVLLRRNPALESLQTEARFTELLEQNRTLAAADPIRRYPLLTLRPEADLPPHEDVYPALLALHANTATAQQALPFWEPLAESGWLVGAAQSTQAVWRGAYVWDDQEYTRGEIKRIFELFHQQYPLDPTQFLLAGQDTGAEAALWLAASGELSVSGVIAVEPDGPLTRTTDAWDELLSRPQVKELPLGLSAARAYLLAVQPLAPERLEALQALGEALNIAGYPAHLEILPAGALEDIQLRAHALNTAAAWLMNTE